MNIIKKFRQQKEFERNLKFEYEKRFQREKDKFYRELLLIKDLQIKDAVKNITDEKKYELLRLKDDIKRLREKNKKLENEFDEFKDIKHLVKLKGMHVEQAQKVFNDIVQKKFVEINQEINTKMSDYERIIKKAEKTIDRIENGS
jgi:hypothetical protein